jgi:uncharacterized protein YukJ
MNDGSIWPGSISDNLGQEDKSMALKNYGVLKGKVVDAQRESDPNSPHYQVHMQAGGKDYRIAVNVKSQMAPSDLLFLVDETFQHPILSKISDYSEDFHLLSSKPDSGSLDFIRGNLFSRQDMRLLPNNLPGPDNDLSDKIEHYINRAKLDPQADLYAFGVRWGPEKTVADKTFGFKPGNGVHDIHMNQGNSGSFTSDDGVWQDGGLIFHFSSTDQWVAVFLAFQNQAWHTDDKTGHAIPEPVPTQPVPDPTQPAPGPTQPVPGPVGPAPQPPSMDFIIRIVGAMVNPIGPAPEKESVILLNTSPDTIDLNGWAITDKAKNKCSLSGKITAGSPLVVQVKPPVQLGNKGGTITLLNKAGLKVDGVAYTAEQAGKEGWVIAF